MVLMSCSAAATKHTELTSFLSALDGAGAGAVRRRPRSTCAPTSRPELTGSLLEAMRPTTALPASRTRPPSASPDASSTPMEVTSVRSSSTPSGRRSRAQRRAATVLLALLLATAFPSASHATDADLVTLTATTPVTLPPVQSAVARFAVQPTTPGQALTASRAEHRRGKRRGRRTGRGRRDVRRRQPGDRLTISTDEFVRVGRYDVAVSTDDASGTQVVTLPLDRATAVLTVPASLTWTRTPDMCVGSLCLVASRRGDGHRTTSSAARGHRRCASRIVDLRARMPQGDVPRISVTVPEDALPLGPEAPDRPRLHDHRQPARLGRPADGARLGPGHRRRPRVVHRRDAAPVVAHRPRPARRHRARLAPARRPAQDASAQLALKRSRSDLDAWLGEPLTCIYPDATPARRHPRGASESAGPRLARRHDRNHRHREGSGHHARDVTAHRHRGARHTGAGSTEPPRPGVVRTGTGRDPHGGGEGPGGHRALRRHRSAQSPARGCRQARRLATNPPRRAALDGLSIELAGRTEGAQGARPRRSSSKHGRRQTPWPPTRASPRSASTSTDSRHTPRRRSWLPCSASATRRTTWSEASPRRRLRSPRPSAQRPPPHLATRPRGTRVPCAAPAGRVRDRGCRPPHHP